MRWLYLLVVALVLEGCDSTSCKCISRIDAPPQHVFPDAPEFPGWLSVTPVANAQQIEEYELTYASGDLVIHAHMCRAGSSPNGMYPLAIYNHGGFMGRAADPEATNALCEQAAQLGFVWLASDYRGEGGSTGAIEVCLGEVDDVLAMLAIARTQPYVDPTHIAMYGGSHGGCITERAIQRGANVTVAADLFGPTDWTALDDFWSAQIAAHDPNTGTYQQLQMVLERATGGPPATAAAAFDARSPIKFLADFPAQLPIFVAHGTADFVVPAAQSCALAAPLATASFHDDGTGTALATAPPGCDTLAVQAPPEPTTWPGARYLVIYDGLGHETQSAPAQVMLQDVAEFLMARLH